MNQPTRYGCSRDFAVRSMPDGRNVGHQMTHIQNTTPDEPRSSRTQAEPPWRLPRRDYFLLPAIFALTIALLLGGGEVVARWLYVQDDAAEPCEYATPTGFRYHPMCTSHTKVWEGPWITQHFNDCGYRSADSCALRPPGSLRVVVVGSSTARGALVNYDESFAARASAGLSRQCGALVDFQNLGTEPTDVDRIDLRMQEAVGLHPSAIVMTVGPFDIIHLKDGPPVADQDDAGPRFSLGAVMHVLRESRLFLVMQYYLYRDPAFQVRAFLLNHDPADYVRAPLSKDWQRRVDDFGELLKRIKAQAGNVPVLLFYIPERAQAALAAMPVDPPGVDPYSLQKTLETEAAQDGVQFFDATKAFATAPDFQSLFYLTDGHPQAGGHLALAGVVEQALLTEPGFQSCKRVSAR